jgi:hypothetical protein
MIAVQDVFVIPDGAAGAMAELERRKFTAEEGVSMLSSRLVCSHIFPRTTSLC